MNKFIQGVGILLELTGIVGLTGIALKRNNDCYKAQMKLVDTELKCSFLELDNTIKENKINLLETELNKFKNEES